MPAAAQAEPAHAARVTTLGELGASIAHEVNQPLAGHRHARRGRPALAWARRAGARRGARRIERMIGDGRAREPRSSASCGRWPEGAGQTVRLTWTRSSRTRCRWCSARSPAIGCGWARSRVAGLPQVLVDRVQLQQVVINLVLNAIQAMDAVTDRPRLLRSNPRPADEAVRSEVRDTGIGIDPCQQEPPVRAVLHDQAGRHGHGAVDLPLDRRGAWRAHLGVEQRRPGNNLPGRLAGLRPGTSHEPRFTGPEHGQVRRADRLRRRRRCRRCAGR